MTATAAMLRGGVSSERRGDTVAGAAVARKAATCEAVGGACRPSHCLPQLLPRMRAAEAVRSTIAWKSEITTNRKKKEPGI